MLSRLEAVGGPRAAAVAVGCAYFVYKFVVREPRHLTTQLIALLIALLILPVFTRRPTATLCALLVLTPFQVVLYSWMFRNGAPASLVRQLGVLKDLLLVGLLVRGALDWLARGRGKLSRLDLYLLLYMGVLTTYLVAPSVLHGLSDIPFTQRLTAWRLDMFFLLILLALRWMQPGRINHRAVKVTVLLCAGLVAAGAVWEHFDTAGWDNFLYTTLGVQQYSAVVLGSPIPAGGFVEYAANGTVRSGSVLQASPFAAFYLLPGYFLALSLIASRRALLGSALTGLIALGMVSTQTRSALLVALLGTGYIIFKVLRSGSVHIKAFVPVLVVALAFAPVLIAKSAVVNRVSSAISGSDTSSQGHSSDLNVGLQRAYYYPFGTGLGTGAGGGQRFSVRNQATTENAYLQVIVETGIASLLLYVGIFFLLTRRLLALPVKTGSVVTDRSAALALMMAMLLGGLLQTVWLSFAVSVTAIVVMTLPFLEAQALEPTDASSPEGVTDESGPHPGRRPPAPRPRGPGSAGSRAPRTQPAGRRTTAPGPSAPGR